MLHCWQSIRRLLPVSPHLTKPIVNSRYLRSISGSANLKDFISSGADTPKGQPDIYVSEATDPYLNLSIEDWLFRNSPSENPLLFIYRDSPCVVIGRNQNPWTEIHIPALELSRVPFIRRRSGGGTVYHDLGNTNFSIHLPRNSFDRHATGELVLQAVRSLGIDAQLNDRNDICVGSDKVSGSAYKIAGQRAYHHGTMLISTQLQDLGRLLRPEKVLSLNSLLDTSLLRIAGQLLSRDPRKQKAIPQKNIVTKGVASVRSPVCNLQQYNGQVTHERFTAAVIEEFRRKYSISTQPCLVCDSEDVRNIDNIRKGVLDLKTWEWMYGQTPEFSHTLNHQFDWGYVTAIVRSKHGRILDCTFQVDDAPSENEVPDLAEFSEKYYPGRRYGFLGENDATQKGESGPAQGDMLEADPRIKDVRAWIDCALT